MDSRIPELPLGRRLGLFQTDYCLQLSGTLSVDKMDASLEKKKRSTIAFDINKQVSKHNVSQIAFFVFKFM